MLTPEEKENYLILLVVNCIALGISIGAFLVNVMTGNVIFSFFVFCMILISGTIVFETLKFGIDNL